MSSIRPSVKCAMVFPAFDKDNLYLLALRDLLKYTMQDQYDNIGWWLYEAPDAGYTVSWEEAGKGSLC